MLTSYSTLLSEPGVQAGVVPGVRPGADGEPQDSRWRTGGDVEPRELLHRKLSRQRPLRQRVCTKGQEILSGMFLSARVRVFIVL